MTLNIKKIVGIASARQQLCGSSARRDKRHLTKENNIAKFFFVTSL